MLVFRVTKVGVECSLDGHACIQSHQWNGSGSHWVQVKHASNASRWSMLVFRVIGSK
jgi:hypothetical protein